MRRRPLTWLGALTLAFAFRLAYGLASIFWTEDERQTYLIGLRSFARGEWPFFGGDVVWSGSQLPGALQGLLVRLPLEVWNAPEAPFVCLNLLSFAALALLAWYTTRRVPEVPEWIVWSALLTLPWTLNFSTHIVNTSYILPGAVVFFVGFFEASPTFRIGALPFSLAWLAMGAGLLFLVQIHMSWVLLPAYALFAAADLWRHSPKALWPAAAAFVVGAACTGLTLVPTLSRYGITAGGVEQTVLFLPQGPGMLLTILARFLSFPSLETNRFLGLDTAERLMFLWRQPWVLPFAALATIVGVIQPVAMVVAWFRRSDGAARWVRIRWLVVASVCGTYASFFFSVRGPLAHTFYVLFPVAAVYAAYVWRAFAVSSHGVHGSNRWYTAWGPRIAAASLVSGLFMHAGLAIDRAPRRSLYLDRPLVDAAITTPNDRFLGDRRDSLIEAQDRTARPLDPVADRGAYNNATAAADLRLVRADWRPLLGNRVSRFVVSISNAGKTAAYVDIRYEAEYVGEDGVLLARREGVIKEILQPGSSRTWQELTNGMVPEGAVGATLGLIGAEKCIPVRTPPRLSVKEAARFETDARGLHRL